MRFRNRDTQATTPESAEEWVDAIRHNMALLKYVWMRPFGKMLLLRSRKHE